MAKVNLMPNESIILKSTNVAHGGLMAVYTDDLILTNQNIIHVKRGVFGNTKNVKKYPVNQIKIFNGIPQAILGKQRSGNLQLEIYFLNGLECYGFQTFSKKRDCSMDKCHKLLSDGR